METDRIDRTSEFWRDADFLLLFAHRGNLEKCFEEHPDAFNSTNEDAKRHVQKQMDISSFSLVADTADKVLNLAREYEVLEPILYKKQPVKYWVFDREGDSNVRKEEAYHGIAGNPPVPEERIICRTDITRPVDSKLESSYIDEPLYYTPSIRFIWEQTKLIVDEAKNWRTLTPEDVYFLALVLDQPFFENSHVDGSICEWSCYVHQLFLDHHWRTYVD